jgi:LysM repeat protein
MKLYRLLPILALLAVAACGSRPLPTPNPPTAVPATSTTMPPTATAVSPATDTVPAPSPTPLAGYPAPAPSSTPVPSLTLPAFQPTVTAVPFTPLPPATIIGQHIVQPGETIFCIARGYGVLPAAIAQANGLSQIFLLIAGQALQIPAVQWLNIAPGPVCPPQFASPFPGLPVPTNGLAASLASAGQPLAVSLVFYCILNCGSKDGTYELQVDVRASGGVMPYTYDPAQSFDVSNLPHCQAGQGSVTVTTSDNQTRQATWTYIDAACP